jgi:hypothetical protein
VGSQRACTPVCVLAALLGPLYIKNHPAALWRREQQMEWSPASRQEQQKLEERRQQHCWHMQSAVADA